MLREQEETRPDRQTYAVYGSASKIWIINPALIRNGASDVTRLVYTYIDLRRVICRS